MDTRHWLPNQGFRARHSFALHLELRLHPARIPVRNQPKAPSGRWSKRRITAQIQEYYIQGRRIGILGCGDILLGLAAKRHFGTWLEAVKASGLESRMPALIPTRFWSPEVVRNSIRLLAETDEVSSTWKKDKRLYKALFKPPNRDKMER